jgi:hypothetical protein
MFSSLCWTEFFLRQTDADPAVPAEFRPPSQATEAWSLESMKREWQSGFALRVSRPRTPVVFSKKKERICPSLDSTTHHLGYGWTNTLYSIAIGWIRICERRAVRVRVRACLIGPSGRDDGGDWLRCPPEQVLRGVERTGTQEREAKAARTSETSSRSIRWVTTSRDMTLIRREERRGRTRLLGSASLREEYKRNIQSRSTGCTIYGAGSECVTLDSRPGRLRFRDGAS